MIPGGTLSTTSVPGRIIGGRAYTEGPLEDFETGGVALNDPSQGLLVKVWRAWIEQDKIYLDSPEDAPVELYAGFGLTEVSLAFDQNMRYALCYVEEEEPDVHVAKLDWYDSTIPGRDVIAIPGALTPRICMDDKRPLATGENDLLLAYVREGKLYHRRQRDRFLNELWLADVGEDMALKRFGMSNRLRLQFELVRIDW